MNYIVIGKLRMMIDDSCLKLFGIFLIYFLFVKINIVFLIIFNMFNVIIMVGIWNFVILILFMKLIMVLSIIVINIDKNVLYLFVNIIL